MEQLTIPHNKALMEEISSLAASARFAGGYLLSGSGDLTAAAAYLAAAMECRHPQKAPCGVCESCRKVVQRIHPDVVWVEDTERKNYGLDIVRSLAADAYILPNEGARKVYIFPDCDRLEVRGQNTLLKVLEEGPQYASFLFLSRNPAQIIPTVRSRCCTLRVLSQEELGHAAHPDAIALCALIEKGNPLYLSGFFADLETGKRKREELQTILSDTCLLLMELASSAEDPRRLYQAAQLCKETAEALRFNLSVGHTAMALSVKLSRL